LFLSALAVFFLVLTAIPAESEAQTMVVANFSGKRNTKKVGRAARSAIVKALSNEGASLVSYKQYLRKAKRSRISRKRALRTRSIKKMARKMKLDAVITGKVKKRGRRYIVTVIAYGANGSVLAKKNYRLKRARFPSSVAGKFASMVMGKLGGGGEVEPEPPPPVEPEPPPPPVEPDPVATGTGDTGTGDVSPAETGDTGSKDAFLPPWARTDKKEGDTGTTATADTTTTTTPEVAKPAPRLKRRKRFKAGAVPEILLSVGMSMNKREGLHPRHDSGIFPGVRIDGRFFLGAFLDTSVVKDIGFGGMFNMGLGLQYQIEEGEAWDSSQMQWAGELLYRLALNDVTLQPTFMLRVGYGSTACTMPEEAHALAISAGYSYPYAALDIYLMLYKPILRFNVSGGYLFVVSPGEDLKGDGSGFTVRAGFDVDLFNNLHIGLGWEMLQFTITDDAIGETSDMYHGFFGRIGWNFK
jgi:opacity protein-like surface antigen